MERRSKRRALKPELQANDDEWDYVRTITCFCVPGTTTERVEDEEALETRAGIRQATQALSDLVNELFADSLHHRSCQLCAV